MRSNRALLKNLRKLSPLFGALVDRALKEKIHIFTFDNLLSRIPLEFLENTRKLCQGKILGAMSNFRHASKVKIPNNVILVRWPEFKKISQWPELKYFKIPDDDLMVAELCFSHEIGHNMIREFHPSCFDVSVFYSERGGRVYIRCAYSEILAWRKGLEIIAELSEENSLEQFSFQGRYVSHFSALQFIDVFNILERQSKICVGLGLYQMKGCPKGGEIHRLIESAETEWLESWRKWRQKKIKKN